MKKNELKILAQKIAKAEHIIQHSNNPKDVAKAKDDILELSGRAMTIEDMLAIDEIVQEILENSRKVSQQYRDLYQKGLLYILKRSYFEDCEKLLDPHHIITYDEFTSISEDHALYKEFGGNGHGDEN